MRDVRPPLLRGLGAAKDLRHDDVGVDVDDHVRGPFRMRTREPATTRDAPSHSRAVTRSMWRPTTAGARSRTVGTETVLIDRTTATVVRSRAIHRIHVAMPTRSPATTFHVIA